MHTIVFDTGSPYLYISYFPADSESKEVKYSEEKEVKSREEEPLDSQVLLLRSNNFEQGPLTQAK